MNDDGEKANREEKTIATVEPKVILDANAPLTLPDNLTVEEWETVGWKLREAEQWTQWAIGEWLNYGERKWGDTYQRAAEITGRSVASLHNIAAVCKKVSPRGETSSITFSHAREVAPLEPAERAAKTKQQGERPIDNHGGTAYLRRENSQAVNAEYDDRNATVKND